MESGVRRWKSGIWSGSGLLRKWSLGECEGVTDKPIRMNSKVLYTLMRLRSGEAYGEGRGAESEFTCAKQSDMGVALGVASGACS